MNSDQASGMNKTKLVIQPTKGWTSLKLKEIWEYRDLFYFLIWRDIKVRYKQTLLGVFWIVFQPILTMTVFSVIFGYLAKVPTEGIPYPIFAFCALLPWQLFSKALNESGNSLVANQQLITKVYFPRLIIPVSTVIAGLVDFCIGFLVLLLMMLFYGIVPTFAILTLPFFVFIAILTALAVGLWFSALNVQYRDIRNTIPFLTQLWLFITPIVYPSSLIPEQWRVLYGLNPMVGVVEGFRWALLGQKVDSEPLILISIIVIGIIFLSGLFYFKKMEKIFADVV